MVAKTSKPKPKVEKVGIAKPPGTVQTEEPTAAQLTNKQRVTLLAVKSRCLDLLNQIDETEPSPKLAAIEDCLRLALKAAKEALEG